MKLPSGSSIQRSMLCPASTVLPKVSEIREDSEKGTGVHEYLRRYLNGESPEECIKSVPERFHEDCKEVDLSKLSGHIGCQTEIAYAYNPFTRTSRILGQNIGRAYEEKGWKPKEEFPCTVDYVRDADGKLFVGDFKTGNAFTTEPAKSNWQLLLGAVAASVQPPNGVGRRDSVLVEICKTKGSTRFDQHELFEFDIQLAKDGLEQLARTVLRQSEILASGKPPTYVTGDHCNYCPSFSFCQAQMALVWRVHRAPSLFSEDLEAAIQTNPGEAYVRYREVKRVLRKLDALFANLARKDSISLPDGSTYGPVQIESQTLEPHTFLRVIRDELGEDIAREAATFEVTKSGIERAVKLAKDQGLIKAVAPVVRKIFAVAREAGGVITETKTELRVTGKKGSDE